MVTGIRFIATKLIDATNNQMTAKAGDWPTNADYYLDLEFDRGYLHRSVVTSDLYIDFQRSEIDTIVVARISCLTEAGMDCYQLEELWFCY